MARPGHSEYIVSWKLVQCSFSLECDEYDNEAIPYYTPALVQEIDEEVRKRVIIHYTCAWKPWIYPCDNPLCFEYYKYLALSPWKGFKPQATVWKRIRWEIHKMRIAVGLLKKGIEI